jgi:hypothetical protein
MAAPQSPLAQAAKLPQEAERARAAEVSTEQALVPSPRNPCEGDQIAVMGSVVRLPVQLDVSIPVREFRIRTVRLYFQQRGANCLLQFDFYGMRRAATG